jgi:hypothetical protein
VHCTAKQGHMQSIGAGNVPARRRARACPRVAAVPLPCATVPRPGLEVWACARRASASHAPPGAASAGGPTRHTACTRSPRRRPCPPRTHADATAVLLTDKRRIPLRSASVRTPHLFHHGIPKVLVNPRSKGITSVRSTTTH